LIMGWHGAASGVRGCFAFGAGRLDVECGG
jgi:hypothetical protein